MRVASVGMTDVGLKRGHNEDNYLINDELSLFVVADGMGGHAGGEYASAICVTTVEEIISTMEIHEDVGEGAGDIIEIQGERIRYAIRLAGRRIFEKANEEREFHGMGTTAVAVLLSTNHAFVAHVGDSRVYRKRNGVLEQLTEDHSLVNEKLKAGLITEEEARNHKMRNVITRSLGYQEEVEVDLGVVPVEPGDEFILCSDGLSGHLDGEELGAELHGSLLESARRMVEIACQRGGEDNITVVLFRVEEVD